MPYYATTPKEVQEVLQPLRGEISRLVRLWAEWKGLYRNGQANIDLLNEMAGPFAVDHWRYLFESVVLAISHLLAERVIQGTEQCSLAQLSQELLPHDVWVALNKLRSATIQKANTIEALRDNAIAHRSLELVLGTGEKLPPIPWDDVDQVVADIQQIYNSVVGHYEGHPESFELHESEGRRAAETLLTVFKAAKHCQNDHRDTLFAEFKSEYERRRKGQG